MNETIHQLRCQFCGDLANVKKYHWPWLCEKHLDKPMYGVQFEATRMIHKTFEVMFKKLAEAVPQVKKSNLNNIWVLTAMCQTKNPNGSGCAGLAGGILEFDNKDRRLDKIAYLINGKQVFEITFSEAWEMRGE